MGMSASQARLLTITGRITDNEMRSQTITNAKLRLAQKSSEASQVYMNALSSEKLVFKSYNENGQSSTCNLTPALIYSYEPLKNQYSIQNASGQNLVSATDAKNFEETDSLEEFLKRCGIEIDTSDKDQYEIDIKDYNNKLKDYNDKLKDYNDKKEKYDKEYQEWLANKDSPDLYKEFSNIVGTSKNPQSCYQTALNGGSGCYVHILAHLLDYQGGENCSTAEYTASNGQKVKFSVNDVSGSWIHSSGKSADFKPLSDEIAKEKTYCDGDDNSKTSDKKENLIQAALDAGNKPSVLEILKSDYVYDEANNKVATYQDGEPQLKTLRQKAIDLLCILKNNMITDNAEMKETLINFTDGDMKKITKDQPKEPKNDVGEAPSKPKEPTYAFAVKDKDKGQWYINLWYMMNGSESANKLQDSTNFKGETIYTANGADKNSNSKNYKVIDDQLLTSSDWLTFALKNGIVTLKQASYYDPTKQSNKALELATEGFYWNATAYSSTTDIVSVEDEVAIAKAEVKYKNTTTEIENQDKKYDQDLKKLDTEHNALQTEYESLKNVIDKNVERSFKAFS